MEHIFTYVIAEHVCPVGTTYR